MTDPRTLSKAQHIAQKIHAMGKWPKGIPYPHQQEQA